MLIRAVPSDAAIDAGTGSMWHDRSDDGLHFEIGDAPVLSSEAGVLDARGCEDRTVVLHAGEVIVFCTGVDTDGDGHLLWASGPDVRLLEKRGIALRSFDGERDIKEAESGVRDGHWTTGYEYVRGEALLIGYTEGDGPAGRWRQTKHGFGPRADWFDSWHLSPGPMLLVDPDRPIMSYNGATRDATWGVGRAVFDHPNNRVLDRCEVPLIAPPGAEDGRDIAFAASLIDWSDTVWLHLSYNDPTCHRALIARTGENGA